MELETFVMLGISRGFRFDNKAYGMDFSKRKKLAALTKHVVYHCNFDTEGKCTNYKGYRSKGPCMCCCNGCHYNIGYLHSFPTGSGYAADQKNNNKELKVYARHFSGDTITIDGHKRPIGFWRPGKGCALPRSYRSNTCLEYDCERQANRSDWEKTLFKLLTRNMKFPVTIRKQKYSEYNVVDVMTKWYEEISKKKDD